MRRNQTHVIRAAPCIRTHGCGEITRRHKYALFNCGFIPRNIRSCNLTALYYDAIPRQSWLECHRWETKPNFNATNAFAYDGDDGDNRKSYADNRFS
jgi:hypothetical protein